LASGDRVLPDLARSGDATCYPSLAALIASAATPFILWWLGQLPETKLFALLTILLWIMHRANISRLLDGTEGKMRKPAGLG
jgi:glycerol-3-phosphate acyltransferase PlsY